MDDGFAREGVLTRCNANREDTLADEECANARRADAALALQAERAREAELDRESSRVASLSPSFAVYAEGSDPLGRRTLDIEAPEPPSNDLVIPAPQIELTELTVLRPLADETARQ